MTINNEQMSYIEKQVQHIYYVKQDIIQKEDRKIRNKLFDNNKRLIIKLLQTGKAKIKKDISVRTPLLIMSTFDFPKNFDADYKKQARKAKLNKNRRNKILEEAYQNVLNEIMLSDDLDNIKRILSRFENSTF